MPAAIQKQETCGYFMRGRLLEHAHTAGVPFFYGSPYFPEGRKEVG